MAFQLDTGGAVYFEAQRGSYRWSDLTPFTQGFIRAGFESAWRDLDTAFALDHMTLDPYEPAFSDLSPASLARIMGDCEAMQADWPLVQQPAGLGATYWRERQAGRLRTRGFPPLAFVLSDDGRVEVQDALTPTLAKPEVGEG